MEPEPEPTDGELMRSARRDPRAFDSVYVRHARVIHAWLAGQVRDDLHAWELTAEVFAQAWLVRARFRPDEDGSARPWLFGIAKNVHRHALRRRRAELAAVRRLRVHLDLTTPCDEDDRLERMTADALGPRLEQSLDRLPHDQREAIQLRVLDELPYEEIATRLHCTTATVRMRVMRGLRALDTDLKERPS